MAAETTPQPVAATSFLSLLQVLFGLGMVLAAIGGTAWLLRKLAPGQVAASGALRVVGGVAVGPKERVVLVDVGETRLVLGVAPGHIATLHQMPRPAEEPTASSNGVAAGPFYTRLKELLNKREQA
ncbi:MAG TPA: flagellar biosynthetic protein FliO [Methylophilaceae bacterium]|nr:flagellar biosynthetic protein FliO [Methylophilaceae bacterium]